MNNLVFARGVTDCIRWMTNVESSPWSNIVLENEVVAEMVKNYRDSYCRLCFRLCAASRSRILSAYENKCMKNLTHLKMAK
jgi:hypothetical protein